MPRFLWNKLVPVCIKYFDQDRYLIICNKVISIGILQILDLCNLLAKYKKCFHKRKRPQQCISNIFYPSKQKLCYFGSYVRNIQKAIILCCFCLWWCRSYYIDFVWTHLPPSRPLLHSVMHNCSLCSQRFVRILWLILTIPFRYLLISAA